MKHISRKTVLISLGILVIVAVGYTAWLSMQTSNVSNTQTYVALKEWGVRFKLSQGLAHVIYFEPDSSTGNTSFTFTTTDLSSHWPDCSPSSRHIVLGLITRSAQEEPASGKTLAKINNYFYQYRGPQAACSDDPAAESRLVHLFMESLKSLQAL